MDRQLPEKKQSSPCLYVTAQEAYHMWLAAPDRVKIIDVRTPEGYALSGHPEMVWKALSSRHPLQRWNKL